jgi:SAM-dependent methyltransferase
VAGIPVLIADDATRRALHTLEAEGRDEALLALLGLADDGLRERFRALLDRKDATYREALAVLCEDAEADYCLHRFTDPTYVTTEALLLAIGSRGWPVAGRVLDLCGGSGHLTRVLHRLRAGAGSGPSPGTFLADLQFWKLWLARTFMVPDAALVCCDANSPLPFAPRTFSLVHLADAYPYVWHKRLLAEEMMRLVGDEGVVVMPHLHSALGENLSAGDTLTPAAYRSLFRPLEPRLFSDRVLFEDAVERGVVDLSGDVAPEELGEEPTLTLVAGRRDDLFRRYEVPRPGQVAGALTPSPLYRVARNGTSSVLTLAFPTPEYEEEFGACRRYLPDHVTVEADLTAPIAVDALDAELSELRVRRVLIDAPVGYC